MQAIHNYENEHHQGDTLFQRAKIQDKCKQFTTVSLSKSLPLKLFQRAKIQDKCKQFTTVTFDIADPTVLFQRAKIQDKCKQFTTVVVYLWMQI